MLAPDFFCLTVVLCAYRLHALTHTSAFPIGVGVGAIWANCVVPSHRATSRDATSNKGGATQVGIGEVSAGIEVASMETVIGKIYASQIGGEADAIPVGGRQFAIGRIESCIRTDQTFQRAVISDANPVSR